jgi:MSHA pilin protein MshD
MNRQRQEGFTLIEVIIFIVVVSAGLAGILSVSNTVVKSSADPMVRKQALTIAESLLEEIVLKEFCDPDTASTTTKPTTCPARIDADQEASRNNYDDVHDYSGYCTTAVGGATTACASGIAGIVDATGTPSLNNYSIWPAVVVSCVGADLVTAAATCIAAPYTGFFKVVVSVTDPQSKVISLTGYRGNY